MANPFLFEWQPLPHFALTGGGDLPAIKSVSFLSQLQPAPGPPVTCKDLVTEGGALHCIAMTQLK
ncbi:MAG: hypothetical protein NTV80_11370 [Verrucomicrobia bacterium]|nr:hypothetical protein [Verrucomicrobiota bacterium]